MSLTCYAWATYKKLHLETVRVVDVKLSFNSQPVGAKQKKLKSQICGMVINRIEKTSEFGHK